MRAEENLVAQDEIIEALRRAVNAVQTDAALRLHLAELLISAGRPSEAVVELASLLAIEPAHDQARALMVVALTPIELALNPLELGLSDAPQMPIVGQASASTPAVPGSAPASSRFDWRAAESELSSIAEPMFVFTADADAVAPHTEPSEAFEILRPTVTLDDVGGMEQVKDRLNAAFLAPLRNPELRRLYGKSLRGGLLLYGPPGCGKTFLAKALAGELGAAFVSAGLSDILDMWIGSSERNMHELFSQARRLAPCVLFLDEIDALAQKRTQNRNSASRGLVNQLLAELDGVSSQNEGVYVLAATNQPWDIDPAMRRPGRLDRTVLVLPPDAAARESIFRYHLATRPVQGVNLSSLAARSNGLSGADIAYVCELATEAALMDGVRTGHARLMGMADLEIGLAQVTPSTSDWLDTVRTIVQYGQDDGTFGELKAYLKKVNRW